MAPAIKEVYTMFNVIMAIFSAIAIFSRCIELNVPFALSFMFGVMFAILCYIFFEWVSYTMKGGDDE